MSDESLAVLVQVKNLEHQWIESTAAAGSDAHLLKRAELLSPAAARTGR